MTPWKLLVCYQGMTLFHNPKGPTAGWSISLQKHHKHKLTLLRDLLQRKEIDINQGGGSHPVTVTNAVEKRDTV